MSEIYEVTEMSCHLYLECLNKADVAFSFVKTMILASDIHYEGKMEWIKTVFLSADGIHL